MSIVLIRTGCTDFDDQNRIRGTIELPLNERGRKQVDVIVEALRDAEIPIILTAPSNPALSTATLIGEELGVRVKELDGLHNVDQGLWQGLQVEEVQRKFPKAYKQWCETPETICPPEGETILQATDRLQKALKKPLKKYDSFAIVASEPLATVIACLIRGSRPVIPDNGGVNCETAGIEYLVRMEHAEAAAGESSEI